MKSLNSRINKKTASEVASKAGISLHALRERAKHKGIVATKISNINYYIDEILKLFKKGGINILEGELKKQIFGYEIFAENSNIPFQKYKKDIARQLKLIR